MSSEDAKSSEPEGTSEEVDVEKSTVTEVSTTPVSNVGGTREIATTPTTFFIGILVLLLIGGGCGFIACLAIIIFIPLISETILLIAFSVAVVGVVIGIVLMLLGESLQGTFDSSQRVFRYSTHRGGPFTPCVGKAEDSLSYDEILCVGEEKGRIVVFLKDGEKIKVGKPGGATMDSALSDWSQFLGVEIA